MFAAGENENDQVLSQYTFIDEGYGNLISEFDGTDTEYHQYGGLGSASRDVLSEWSCNDLP